MSTAVPFDTSQWEQAIAERQSAWEQVRWQTMQSVLTWLDQWGTHYGLERAVLFGSVVMPGRFHERADIDIAVDSLEPERFFDLMAALSLEMGRDVDLVDLSECHFAGQIWQKGVVWTKDG